MNSISLHRGNKCNWVHSNCVLCYLNWLFPSHFLHLALAFFGLWGTTLIDSQAVQAYELSGTTDITIVNVLDMSQKQSLWNFSETMNF